jgi:virginiamycin A acetyltransferase
VGIPELKDLPYKGDTVIENDVWIGYNATIMLGRTLATVQSSPHTP